MRLLLLIFILALFCTPVFAMDDGVPEDLHEADFITAVDVEAEVPYGDLFIDEAVIAIFPRLEDRLGGILIGRARLRVAQPPMAQVTAQEKRGSTNRKIEFKVTQAYLSASLKSEWKVAPKGRALAARRWDGLKQAERDAFLKLYNAALPESWSEASTASGAAVLRDPAGKEFFTAFWAPSPKIVLESLAQLDPAAARDPKQEVRFDFRVDSAGTTSLSDRETEQVLFKLSNLRD